MELLKIGELARRTGLTVRTLHHYDEIGLLEPSRRSEAGYRLYAKEDLVRLQQIRSLQQIGLSLEEIRRFLDRSEVVPLTVVELHLERLGRQIELLQQLRRRLTAVARRFTAAEEVSADEVLKTIEVMTMFDKYYTPEQRQAMEQRAAQVGAERMAEVEAEWRDLFARFREEMEKGSEPGSDAVQALSRQAGELIAEFTGGRQDVAQSLGEMYRQEGPSQVLQPHGFDVSPELWQYMQAAGTIRDGKAS